ncbi:MAG: biotin transporter BioY, partial [Clostridia bacterium]|nr:biotin transporter BioY [Clostridia bacterium]
CAWISFPIAQVPITLQALAVALVGGLMGWKRGIAAIFVYVLMGLIGIPVFSNFGVGPGVLFGPTGGYIFGFFFLALAPALFKYIPVKNKWGRAGIFFTASVLGETACYFFGTIWFINVYHCTVGYALTACVLPFIVPDLVKFAIAALLFVRLEKYVK